MKAAPRAIIVILVLGGLGSWYFASRYYGNLYAERIAVLQARVDAGQAAQPVPTTTTAAEPIRLPYVSRPMALTLVALLALLVGVALRNGWLVDRLRRDVRSKNELLTEAASHRQIITNERDQALAAARDAKEQHAFKCLERYSRYSFTFSGRVVQPRVTIRFASYHDPDYQLVQRLQGLFQQYLKWPVTLDGTNNPALPRAERHKVECDLGRSVTTFSEVVVALNDVLDVTVMPKPFTDRDEDGHLIVSVLPSGKAAPGVDPEDYEQVARFYGQSEAFVREVMYENEVNKQIVPYEGEPLPPAPRETP